MISSGYVLFGTLNAPSIESPQVVKNKRKEIKEAKGKMEDFLIEDLLRRDRTFRSSLWNWLSKACSNTDILATCRN